MDNKSVSSKRESLIGNLEDGAEPSHTRSSEQSSPGFGFRCCGREVRMKSEVLLIALTVLGAFVGILIGSLVKDLSDDSLMLIQFPGEILMRMLKMMIVPIIFTSIVTGVSSLDVKHVRRAGQHAIIYYLCTTLLAILLGISLVTFIQPGNPSMLSSVGAAEHALTISTLDTFLDIIRNIFADNIIAAAFQGVQTRVTTVKVGNASMNETSTFQRTLVPTASTNILGVIVFALLFGLSLNSLEDAEPVKKFFDILNNSLMKMIMGVIWYSPVGICSLVAANVLKHDSLVSLAAIVGLYIMTVTIGLLVHCFMVIPLIYFVMTRKNPYKFYYGVLQSALVALGTGSSAGTLPVTMKCLETNLGIDSKVTRLICPLGATMNMDGTALLEGVAAITVAQIHQIPMSASQIFTISITATIASVGAAAIPSAGLVTLVFVLTSIGVPTEAIGLLWSVDWLLDRLRTAVNVLGDCVGAGIVQHLNPDITTPRHHRVTTGSVTKQVELVEPSSPSSSRDHTPVHSVTHI